MSDSQLPTFTNKRYENLLGQTIREERSGFQDAVLATVNAYDSFGRLVSTVADYEPTTEYTYDTLGNRVATTRVVGRAGAPRTPKSLDAEWRKTETLSSFVLADSIVWLTQTNIVSCSDSAIAPLATSSARQLTGLTAALPARSCSTDIRGNVTENQFNVSVPVVTSSQVVPYATNRPLTISHYGVELQTVSVSAVTNTIAYDSLGRQVANTDGRGNTTHTEYNALGQRSASIDALGNRTTYAYDQFGNLAVVTDPLGNATVYEYDLRGRKTYEGGATYPVRYTYDVFGNKTTMMTYRNESLGPDSGDVTTWLYDVASGSMTNKVYADGKGPSYAYAPDGKLSQRTWARGIVTDYTYDNWGSLTNTVYSDGTPTISLSYDALGRQIEAHDAAGVTTFAYDSFGSLTNETVIGVAGTNTIIRHWDNYGRSQGYSLVGLAAPCQPQRQSTLAYDPATGRLATMHAAGSDTPFTWNYLAGSDLKSSLSYPNGLTASWQYDANNQLLQVCNATPTNLISQYNYAYDVVGRRISCAHDGSAVAGPDTFFFGYDARSELTNAFAVIDSHYRHDCQYDDIGNRTGLTDCVKSSVYTVNQLNQYSLVDDFAPKYDLDGNQTRMRTDTGVWSVNYNSDNRPVLWECGPTNITMKFDCMGRRVEYCVFVNGVINTHHFFVYDGYLCILRQTVVENNQAKMFFGWDPSVTFETRPLWMQSDSGVHNFYVHDGNKNVSELVSAGNLSVSAHYDYFPFGAISSVDGQFAGLNPYCFSSEYFTREIGLHYFNFRHYNSLDGHWINRDKIEERASLNLYCFVRNQYVSRNDILGLWEDNKCEFVILGGHAQQISDMLDELRRDQEKNKKRKKAMCGHRYGAVSCFSDLKNDNIEEQYPGHSIPGMPRNPGTTTYVDIKNPSETDAIGQLEKAWDAAIAAAEADCIDKECCCKEIEVRIICSKDLADGEVGMENHLKQVQEAYKHSKIPKKDWRKTDWCGKTKKISCKDVRRDAERNKRRSK
jgi:RHS repeat-associated protein